MQDKSFKYEIESLPVYAHLQEIAATLTNRGLLLLHAEPGAGKTTLVPWHLLTQKAFAESKMLLLQPRRLAARAAAERIAAFCGERIGQTVGLRTRMETLVGKSTRLEVVTEGVLTRIIQNNPSLFGYSLVIFDEFHERNLQGDMALAFTMECRTVFRPDLGLLFMSATPHTAELRASLGDIETISVPGRSWPVKTLYRPPLTGETPWGGAARLASEARDILDNEKGGGVLVFLPGFREIHRTHQELLRIRPELDTQIVFLHGRLPPEEQRRVLTPLEGPSRQVILTTNVAETSLTIPGVHAVVDSGLERRVSFHPRTAMDHWATVEISEASALQRQGRAGRLGPGLCLRWWGTGMSRRPFSPPEIMEADLAALVLETALWGATSPVDLPWITPPPAGALGQATSLLKDLNLIDVHGIITPAGRRAATLGLHPRLGHMVISASQHGWLATAAVIAAIIEEGDPLKGNDPDFRDRLVAWIASKRRAKGGLRPDSVLRIDREIKRIMQAAGPYGQTLRENDVDPELTGRLLLFAYPDRVAQRTEVSRIGETSRLVLVTGRGAQVKGPLAQEEFLVAAELDGGDTEARIFLAAPVLRSDIEAGLAGPPKTVHCFTWKGWTPDCRVEIRLGRLLLSKKTGSIPDPQDLGKAACERINREGLDVLPWNEGTRRFLARCLFVEKYGHQRGWPDFTPASLLAEIDQWLLPFGNLGGGVVFKTDSLQEALSRRLGWENRRSLDELAPETWELPSGTRKRLDYETGEIPIIAARLQEYFGCRQTPSLCGEHLLLHLLSPAGRPIQITRDLDGFWERTYPDVKRELMGRYPRHHWPENPRAAMPTARTKKKG